MNQGQSATETKNRNFLKPIARSREVDLPWVFLFSFAKSKEGKKK